MSIMVVNGKFLLVFLFIYCKFFLNYYDGIILGSLLLRKIVVYYNNF